MKHRKPKTIGGMYRVRLVTCFAAAFAVFAAALVVFQLRIDSRAKFKSVSDDMDSYARILSKTDDYAHVVALFPEDLRATILDTSGNVLYDSIENLNLENHSDRPEISASLKSETATSVRRSATTGVKYLYYSRTFNDRVIRVAVPYDEDVKPRLRPDSMFPLAAAFLFALSVLMIVLLSSHFSSGVLKLLKLHIQNSDRAVAIFSPGRAVEYSNSLFVQYLSSILGHPAASPDEMWDAPFFAPLAPFMSENSDCLSYATFTYVGDVSGRSYSVRVIIYPETGFEVSMADVTEAQEVSRLKQQMTGNISHELRTPVTSVMGYLETLEACPDMDEERRRNFIHRAHVQTERLSELIRDMSLINKVEESPEKLVMQSVNLREIAEEVISEFAGQIAAAGDRMENLLPDDLVMEGNRTLLYAMFRNLVENSLKYAGDGVRLHLECYSRGFPGASANQDFLYLSYYDTGRGVPPQHLPRLFERFYRITEGRTREDGGSGLGLSIVKNAVAFHGGEIRAVNRSPHGLQFFFSLKRR